MASTAQELADSLAQDEIPIKLRCASCNKLVLDAFRLPCCDQNVCGNCQTELPDTCPVCMHTPLSADDCTPNKALRLTVKAFLKNEEKKRDKLKAEAAPSVTVLPTTQPEAEIIDPDRSAQDVVQSIEEPAAEVRIEPKVVDDPVGSSTVERTNANERDSSVPQDDGGASPNIAIITGDEETRNANGLAFGADSATSDQQPDKLDNQETSNQQQTSDTSNGANVLMNNGSMNGYNGFDPTMMQNAANGMNGMPSMNGMNGWGGFPNMMGMGMDPSMMMFGGFNGQGTGFNGMNMGMMGYDASFGNWGGQIGHGMNGGNFGANAGYYPNSGFNQQSHHGAHFNQMSQRNFPSNHRSGHGQRFAQNAYNRNQAFHDRAGYAQQNGYSVSIQQQQQQQNEQQQPQDLLPDTIIESTEQSDKQEVVKDADSADQPQKENEDVVMSAREGDVPVPDVDRPPRNSTQHIRDESMIDEENRSRPLELNDAVGSTFGANTPAHQPEPFVPQTMDGYAPMDVTSDAYGERNPYNAQTMETSYHQGYHNVYNESGGRGRGGWRGRGRGRGGFRGNFVNTFDNAVHLTNTEPAGQGVVGAPTGPKAMRDGGSAPSSRARGLFAARGGRGGNFGVITNGTSPAPGVPQAASTDMDRSPSSHADGVRDNDRPRSRTRSQSRHRSHRRRRLPSPDHDDHYNRDESSDEHRRSKKRRHSRKYEDDDMRKDSKYETEERPASRDQDGDSRRHNSRKHKSSHRDRDRSRSRDSEHERSEHTSRRRRHRSRSRSPRRQDDEKNDGNDDRTRSRRHRERDSGHRSRDHTDQGSEREKERDRRSHRRDYSTDRKRSSRHKEDAESMPPPSAGAALASAQAASSAPPEAPTGPASSNSAVREFKIQGRSRTSQLSSASTTSKSASRTTKATEPELKRQPSESKPEIDPHTLEREARNRERMLKEAQRMSLLMNRGDAGSGSARGSGGRDKERTSRKDRRRESYVEEDSG